MSTRYVEPGETRFRKEVGEGGELLRIPYRRSWFVLLFLPVWLTGWTIGGVAAFVELLRTGEPFLAVWLIGWLLGELYASFELGNQLAGSKTVRVVGGDLELSSGFGPFRRTRRYRAAHIQRLRSDSSWGLTVR